MAGAFFVRVSADPSPGMMRTFEIWIVATDDPAAAEKAVRELVSPHRAVEDPRPALRGNYQETGASARQSMAPMTTKRLKRPRDPIQLGKLIVDIATGQVQEEQELDAKGKAAVARGRRGGPARAQALTPEQRSEIARAAAQARWKKS